MDTLPRDVVLSRPAHFECSSHISSLLLLCLWIRFSNALLCSHGRPYTPLPRKLKGCCCRCGPNLYPYLEALHGGFARRVNQLSEAEREVLHQYGPREEDMRTNSRDCAGGRRSLRL